MKRNTVCDSGFKFRLIMSVLIPISGISAETINCFECYSEEEHSLCDTGALTPEGNNVCTIDTESEDGMNVCIRTKISKYILISSIPMWFQIFLWQNNRHLRWKSLLTTKSVDQTWHKKTVTARSLACKDISKTWIQCAPLQCRPCRSHSWRGYTHNTRRP